MKITYEMLENTDISKLGRSWFSSKFPKLEVEYQVLMDTLAEEDDDWLAMWLIDKIGTDTSVTRLCGRSLLSRRNLYIAGDLILQGEVLNVSKNIIVGGDIYAECNVRAGGYLYSHRDTKVAADLFAEEGLSTGGDLLVGGFAESRRFMNVGGLLKTADNIYASWGISAAEVKSGRNIYVGNGIWSATNVAARGDIKVGGDINAKGSVVSGGLLRVGWDVRAKEVTAKEIDINAKTKIPYYGEIAQEVFSTIRGYNGEDYKPK